MQGLGAVPVPVDWSEVPTALATGVVSGQENPVNVVLSSKLYEAQSHLMLTDHIMNAQLIVINEKHLAKLSPEQQAAITKAADEVRKRATDMVRKSEDDELAKLKELKMTVIGPAEGLKLDAFKATVRSRSTRSSAPSTASCTRKSPRSSERSQTRRARSRRRRDASLDRLAPSDLCARWSPIPCSTRTRPCHQPRSHRHAAHDHPIPRPGCWLACAGCSKASRCCCSR